MKKLKLSKSKACDTRQQKISNFFTLSKDASSNSTDLNRAQTKEGNIIFKSEAIKNDKRRSPGEKLCTKCLIKSENDSFFCSNCNLASQKPTDLLEIEQAINKPLDVSIQNCQPFCLPVSGVKNSPDIIPPTPPAAVHKGKKVQRLGDKSVKRKFNFSETICKKKTCQSNTKPEFLPGTSEENFKRSKSNSKDNVCSSDGKENDETSNTKNLFHKNLSNPSCLQISVPTDVTTAKCTYEINNIDIKLEATQPVLDLDSIHITSVDNLEKNLKNAANSKLLNRPTDHLSRDDNSLNIDPNQVVSKSERKEELYSTSNLNSLGIHVSLEGNINHTPDPSTCKEREISNQECVKVNDESSTVIEECSVKHSPYKCTTSENEDIDSYFLDDLHFDESIFKEPTRLDSGARCVVVSVEHLEICGEVVLCLRPCDSNDTDTLLCVLKGSWMNVTVNVGDTVSVTAMPMPGQDGCWVIDNEQGLLVVHPDTLVSGTSIVGSLFCMRRSVLSDMYRGMDSESSIMAIGSFLHELLQEVLKRKVTSVEGIKEVINGFISSRHFIFSLYSSGMALDKTKDTLYEFVPKIHAFVQKYIVTNSKGLQVNNWNDGESWSGRILDIADIEENIWAPRLGVKGRIDVTVKTSVRNIQKVMPLELKTGRASFSAEHRGQVILYTMMMSELGQAVGSGLLLYLREGVMKDVVVGSVERRDLMLLRNELVTQLKASHQVVLATNNQAVAPLLPPPIHHHSACAKCPYLTLCSAALRISGSSGVSESNPLQALSVSSTSHLLLEHIVYVFHWTGLLRLEHTETQLKSAALQDIWTLPPPVRKKRGTCVPSVRLVGNVIEVTAGSYEHIFVWWDGAAGATETCNLVEGDYVIVSSDAQPAVAAGPIRHIVHYQLTLHLERDLSVRQKREQIWHLDKYESQTGLVFNMTNLGCLLDNTDQASRLRKAVIDLELPAFSPKLSSRVLKASVDLLAPLNNQQRSAIFRALAADHYILIKGMPGTGKTATIVALVQLAVRLGQSVLITSHTHSAVDNVLLRLRGQLDFLRLGSAHKLHPELSEYGETSCSFKTPDDIHEYYNSKKVVAVTCLGSSHPLLSRRQFDLCLVDEATQVLQPTVFRPLFSARKFILIGDPDQLPPLVRSSQAKKLGLGQSLFVWLDKPAVTSELSLQYRMNQCITRLANTLTYAGRLQCANENVASATLTLPHQLSDRPAWLITALTDSLDKSVIVLDTGETQAIDCTNQVEADILVQILTALSMAGLSEERVGVIAPYRAQVELLRQRTKALGSAVEVNTVDQYQGRDKDVILYSCTRSAKPKESDILGDKNRLTVAITRARHKLIIIGNVSLLRGYPLFNTLFDSIPDGCIIPLT